MSRNCLLAVVVVVLAALTAGTGYSDEKKTPNGPKQNDGKIDNYGKPKGYAPGTGVGYWMWYENDTWHMRTTGKDDKPHKFNGVIETVGGSPVSLRGKVGEFKGGFADRYIYGPTGMTFAFTTGNSEDGVNFKVTPSTTLLKVTVLIDGRIDTTHIRLGKAQDHPPGPVFTLPAHPTRK